MTDRSKQGIKTQGKYVLKRHKTLSSAMLEMKIAQLYSTNPLIPIIVPEYKGIDVHNEEVDLIIEKIDGFSLLGNKDSDITKTLVLHLALFHTMFSQQPHNLSSSALYRDAINSNYILSERGIVHIDFSSSSRFVHGLDDLALLLHPFWGETTENQRENLLKEYVGHRKRMIEAGISAIDRIDSSIVTDKTVDERRKSYLTTIEGMKSAGINSSKLEDEIRNVDFENLDVKDYPFFHKFRDMRGKFYFKLWNDKK